MAEKFSMQLKKELARILKKLDKKKLLKEYNSRNKLSSLRKKSYWKNYRKKNFCEQIRIIGKNKFNGRKRRKSRLNN